jgi:myo-inositol-1(or 4)-monophosphatase
MWERELNVAQRAAKKGGEILTRLFGQINNITRKGEIDLITEADLEAENVILNIISQNFPYDNIISEEAGLRKKSSGRTWIIDPLDGTTNFAHAFPFFAVSIALEIEKEIILGIVYNPYLGEYFEAVQGNGAYLNNRPIHVSKVSSLGESLLGTGFPYNIRKKSKEVVELLSKMIIKAQGIRRPGSAAIDLCYVAAGRLDGFWEQDLKPWDTAAGTIIVKEAGGKLSTFDGSYYTPYMQSIVAANPLIHKSMIKILNS